MPSTPAPRAGRRSIRAGGCELWRSMWGARVVPSCRLRNAAAAARFVCRSRCRAPKHRWKGGDRVAREPRSRVNASRAALRTLRPATVTKALVEIEVARQRISSAAQAAAVEQLYIARREGRGCWRIRSRLRRLIGIEQLRQFAARFGAAPRGRCGVMPRVRYEKRPDARQRARMLRGRRRGCARSNGRERRGANGLHCRSRRRECREVAAIRCQRMRSVPFRCGCST